MLGTRRRSEFTRFFFARNIGTLGNMFTIASLAQDLTVLAR